eukprot:352544-Chlamydomonas_euryale.AAC.10
MPEIAVQHDKEGRSVPCMPCRLHGTKEAGLPAFHSKMCEEASPQASSSTAVAYLKSSPCRCINCVTRSLVTERAAGHALRCTPLSDGACVCGRTARSASRRAIQWARRARVKGKRQARVCQQLR